MALLVMDGAVEASSSRLQELIHLLRDKTQDYAAIAKLLQIFPSKIKEPPMTLTESTLEEQAYIEQQRLIAEEGLDDWDETIE